MIKIIIFLHITLLMSVGWIEDCLAVDYENINNLHISVNTRGLSFDSIVSKIEKQTHYSISTQCIVPVIIGGIYKNVSVDDFFRRLLKTQNVAILIDDHKRVIKVSCLGGNAPAKQSMELAKKSLMEEDQEFFRDIRENGTDATKFDTRHWDNLSGADANDASIDQLTGLPWDEVEKKMGLDVDSSAVRRSVNTKLAQEREKKIKEIEKEICNNLQNNQTVVDNQAQRKEHGKVYLVDSQTGLNWEDAEKVMGLTPE